MIIAVIVGIVGGLYLAQEGYFKSEIHTNVTVQASEINVPVDNQYDFKPETTNNNEYKNRK